MESEELAAARIKFRNETQEDRGQMAQKEAELQTRTPDPKAPDEALMAKQKELDRPYRELSQKLLLYRRDVAKRIPGLDPKRGRGREGRDPGQGFCPAWDEDCSRN